MKIKKIKIKDLKPARYNPRTSTKRQEEKLSESLKKFGVVEPVIFNETTGNIVGGHFRVRELKKLGFKEVDCVIVELSEEDEKELNIRLNANTGAWDFDALANEWDVKDLNNLGLDIPDMQKVDGMEDGDEIELEQSVQIEPPMEYILIMAEPNSEEWEEIKEMLKLKMVRRGGYKKGSGFDALGIERVIKWDDFKTRTKI